MDTKTIGLWMYENSGGRKIQDKICKKLQERDINTLREVDLRNAIAKNGHILHKGNKLDKLDLFLSYNASQQTQYQMYLYKALSKVIPTINSFASFELSEDKFQTAFVLRKNKISTPDYKLCHRDDKQHLQSIIKEWSKMVYKPTDGWGGMGLTKIDSAEKLDMLMPFLNQMDLRYFYVEKFIDYDNTDFRVDIVDGKFVSCYGRKAIANEWRTNVACGGSVFMREANDEVIALALKASKITGLDIAGVDIIYDREKEEYIVLEVNGIPAFATPEQEKQGLNFNDKKIDLIVDLIEKKVCKKKNALNKQIYKTQGVA
ncbi:MAG: hypothetical protein COA66_01415 [Arcobacter sp.]|nr:MAG: hypothetical protein COA66_01415 [Arcobacter sp.]